MPNLVSRTPALQLRIRGLHDGLIGPTRMGGR